MQVLLGRCLLIWLGCALLLSLVGVGFTQQRITPLPSSTFVVRNVRIFDGAQIIDADSVLVSDGVIVAVGKHLAPGSEVPAVDGHGGTLMPGLIDSHTHAYRYVGLQHALLFGVTTELGMEDAPSFAVPFEKSKPTVSIPMQLICLHYSWLARCGPRWTRNRRTSSNHCEHRRRASFCGCPDRGRLRLHRDH
jgi:hypothetical protein